MVCTTDGARWVEGRDCAEWESTCSSDGYCDDACAVPERDHQYVGCEYAAVALPHGVENSIYVFEFRVALANATDAVASVRITQGDTLITELRIEPRGLEVVVLPWFPAFVNGPFASTTAAGASFRIISDQPITATQFNPFEYWNFEEQDPAAPGLEGSGSYSNDASLLLPRHVMTGSYRALGYRDTVGDYFAVVGMDREPTHVRIRPHRNSIIEALTGEQVRSDAVVEFLLHRGEVAIIRGESGRDNPGSDSRQLTIESAGVTGAAVRADHPVAVFGGEVCTTVGGHGACDHLETQLLPTETWGRTFFGAPLVDPALLGRARNLVRILASERGTAVTVTGGERTFLRILGPGDAWDMWASGPYRVTANHPVSIAQFLEGALEGETRGDPALTLLAPREQFLEDYLFVTPSSYIAETHGQSFIMVTRSVDTLIELDGDPLDIDWQPDGEMEVGYLAVDGGTHRLHGTEPIGLQAYGLGYFTSYAYPGGLSLTHIQPSPGPI